MGFPLIIALVILLGSSLVIYARSSRGDAVAPKLNVGAAGVTGDHWHAALGIYNCDRFETDAIVRGDQWPDPSGIHSHNDDVIHIHPFVSSAAGTRARLKVFFETMGLKFDDDELELTNGNTLKSGTDCNGKNATLRIARFDIDNPEKPIEIITSGLGDVRFLADRESFTIALVPDGIDIPAPPTAANLDELAGIDSGQVPAANSPTTTIAPTDSTVPGSTTPVTTAPSGNTTPTTGSPTSTSG
ncbi:MAG: hypothetical protein ABIQ73_05445 [Acidimicrobiales bacterium]